MLHVPPPLIEPAPRAFARLLRVPLATGAALFGDDVGEEELSAALAWAGARVVFDPGLRLRAPAASPAGAAAGPQVSAECPPGAIPGGGGREAGRVHGPAEEDPGGRGLRLRASPFRSASFPFPYT